MRKLPDAMRPRHRSARESGSADSTAVAPDMITRPDSVLDRSYPTALWRSQ